MITGYLTETEEHMALLRAKILNAEAAKSGSVNKYGAVELTTYEEEVAKHLVGQRGEIFCARACGKTANFEPNTFGSTPDIGDRGQVRTRSKAYYDLIVRKDAKPDEYYILVISDGIPGHPLTVVGYIKAEEAMQAKYLRDYGGFGEAYFVPQDALTPIGSTYGEWA